VSFFFVIWLECRIIFLIIHRLYSFYWFQLHKSWCFNFFKRILFRLCLSSAQWMHGPCIGVKVLAFITSNKRSWMWFIAENGIILLLTLLVWLLFYLLHHVLVIMMTVSFNNTWFWRRKTLLWIKNLEDNKLMVLVLAEGSGSRIRRKKDVE
jgi:hypothetical protein